MALSANAFVRDRGGGSGRTPGAPVAAAASTAWTSLGGASYDTPICRRRRDTFDGRE